MESELDRAQQIMRIAFGTFIGLSDPATFRGDAASVRSRWRASPVSAFAAEVDGTLAGSNFATRWGTFGFFGPLSLDPVFWNRGLASALIDPAVDSLDTWGVTQAGLFTFAQSPKHIGLYQKFGFYPRSLVLVLERTVRMTDLRHDGWTTYSQLDKRQRPEALLACRHITENIYPGLDVTPEVESIENQSLGDTVLIRNGNLEGFGACHVGAGSEAGSGVCYIKFGAIASGTGRRERFRGLLEACEAFAAKAGATRIEAGVSAARREAYEEMLSAGFRVRLTGVSMHRPNEPGFSRPGVFVIDDWR